MAQPVWVLSVDLQAKTATFQSGMADAARSARGSFGEISGGSEKMGETVGRASGEARHGVMMLGEEFGIHLPRGLTTFIASLGPVGAAMEAAFPFIAIILGATLLLEHLAKLHEAGEKLTDDQMKLGVAVQNAFNSLDEKMLKAEQRADELRGDHLGALNKELELIDRQSMDELVHSFEIVAKAADVVFADLKSHWYTFGIGADGAKHALTEFQNDYDSLLAQGKDKEASDLLRGTKASAEKVLALQKQFTTSGANMGTGSDTEWANSLAHEDARNKLKQFGVTATESEVKAQQALVDTLNAQLQVEAKVAALKSVQKTVAVETTNKAAGKEAEERAKALAEAQQRGVDAMGAMLRDANRQNEEATAEGWREQIDATEQGSAERLAVIDQAIKDEEDRGMVLTGFYRGLMVQRVQVARQMGEEEAKAKAEAGKEAADDAQKMGELILAAQRQHAALLNSAHRQTDAQRADEAVKAANEEEALKITALHAEMAALDKGGKDYQNKLKALQDKEKQMVQQHENDITAIKDKAEMDRNTRILAAEQHFNTTVAAGLTQVLMGHQSFAKMMNSLGNEVVSGMMQNAIQSALMDDFGKEKDAAKAARKAFNIGMEYGGPAGPVLAPVLGAAAFAAVMAFEGGGVVPGIGRSDTVPAMLTPGEGVIPGGVMDNLNRMAKDGGFGQRPHTTIQAHYSPTIQAIDATGVDKMLDKHGDKFQRHVENAIRKMNR